MLGHGALLGATRVWRGDRRAPGDLKGRPGRADAPGAVNEFALLPRVLMVVGAMAVSPTAVPGRTDPPPPKAEPVISSGPKAWALATTAHLTYRNRWRIDMLAPKYRTDATLAETRQILRDWWRIENRLNLLQSLDWLTREGHRIDFQK